LHQTKISGRELRAHKALSIDLNNKQFLALKIALIIIKINSVDA